MTGLLDITTVTLKRDLGIEVHEIYVVIAKHSVLGTPDDKIQEMLGCAKSDYAEVTESEDYKKVRMYVAGRYSEQAVNQTSGWDQIESIAIDNLVKRMAYEKDSEFLLKVAAVANRAKRKHEQQITGILDPASQHSKTVITLTSRLTQKLNGPQSAEVSETRELSISNGSMVNPSFDEVNGLLDVSNKPILSREIEVKTRTVDPTAEEMLKLMR